MSLGKRKPPGDEVLENNLAKQPKIYGDGSIAAQSFSGYNFQKLQAQGNAQVSDDGSDDTIPDSPPPISIDVNSIDAPSSTPAAAASTNATRAVATTAPATPISSKNEEDVSEWDGYYIQKNNSVVEYVLCPVSSDMQKILGHDSVPVYHAVQVLRKHDIAHEPLQRWLWKDYLDSRFQDVFKIQPSFIDDDKLWEWQRCFYFFQRVRHLQAHFGRRIKFPYGPVWTIVDVYAPLVDLRTIDVHEDFKVKLFLQATDERRSQQRSFTILNVEDLVGSAREAYLFLDE